MDTALDRWVESKTQYEGPMTRRLSYGTFHLQFLSSVILFHDSQFKEPLGRMSLMIPAQLMTFYPGATSEDSLSKGESPTDMRRFFGGKSQTSTTSLHTTTRSTRCYVLPCFVTAAADASSPSSRPFLWR